MPIFTIVVNNPQRKPIYNLDEIQNLVGQKEFALANKRATTKTQELGWSISTIQAFLLALKPGHFCKSYEDMSAYDGQKRFDVDGYKMHFDEEGLKEGTTDHLCFWAKFAIEPRKSGKRVAVISIHLDGSP